MNVTSAPMKNTLIALLCIAFALHAGIEHAQVRPARRRVGAKCYRLQIGKFRLRESLFVCQQRAKVKMFDKYVNGADWVVLGNIIFQILGK